MLYLLDTNTCIQAMRSHPIVLSHFAAVSPGDCAISTVTNYELYVGVEKCSNPVKEQTKVDLFVRTLHHVPFGLAASREAARIRAYLESIGTPIGPYDTLLAGQAVASSLVMVTANVKEFSRVPGLVVKNWQT